MAKVGFIGLGWMGLGMCKSMVRSGHEVTVFDVFEGPMDEMLAYGAKKKAASVKEVAENSEYVCVVVRDEPQYKEVVGDLINHLAKGSVVIIHGTVSPQLVRSLAEEGKKKGVTVIDGAITGQKREEGQITVMIGSSEEVFRRVKPVLEPMGRILHMGDVGAGEISKLVNNLIGAGQMLLTTEGLIYGVKAGVTLEKLLDQLSNPESSGCNWAVLHWDNLVEIKKIYKETNGGGPAGLLSKDNSIAMASARALGLELPISSLCTFLDAGKLPEDY